MPTVPRTTLVVGASSDIGCATVLALLERGDRVVSISRSSLSSDLCLPGHESFVFDFSAGVSALDFFVERLSGFAFDNLVYVAGYHKLQRLSRRSDGDLGRHVFLNLACFIDFARAFVGYGEQDSGRFRAIVSIASIAHIVGEAGLVAYSASKGAMVSASRSMAVEYAPKGVRVNTISPGWVVGRRAAAVTQKIGSDGVARIRSEYPLGFGEPRDVALAVRFLTDPESGRWITGTDIVIDGGRSCH